MVRLNRSDGILFLPFVRGGQVGVGATCRAPPPEKPAATPHPGPLPQGARELRPLPPNFSLFGKSSRPYKGGEQENDK